MDQKLKSGSRGFSPPQEAIDDRLGYDPDHINWGHMGTAAHIKEQLDRIIDIIQ